MISRKSIQTVNVDVVVVLDADGDLYKFLLNNLFLIRPFSQKESFAIQNIMQTAYVDVDNHNDDDVIVVVYTDRDPLFHFE